MSEVELIGIDGKLTAYKRVYREPKKVGGALVGGGEFVEVKFLLHPQDAHEVFAHIPLDADVRIRVSKMEVGA